MAHSEWLDMFKSPSCLSECSILVNITAEELQAKGDTLIPRFRDDSDKPGDDGRVEKVLHMSIDITISFKNLVHHGGFLPVRFPFHSLVTVVDGVALHVHLRGEGLAALCNDRSYLLHFEQIDL